MDGDTRDRRAGDGPRRRSQEDTLAWLDCFLPELGHELRTPLMPIRLSVEILDQRLGDDPDTLKPRRVIREQTDRMARVIDHLCLATKVAQGDLRIERHRVFVLDVVKRALEGFASALAARRVTLNIAADLVAWADGKRLTQAVAELVDNSVRYTEDGDAITVDARLSDEAPETLEIEVTDSGVGVPAELLPWATGAFVRGPRAQDQAGHGFGLGLSIADGIVHAHGGQVTLHAREAGNHGTRARIVMPRGAPTDNT